MDFVICIYNDVTVISCTPSHIYITTKDKYMDDDALTSVYIDKIMLT